MTDDGRGAAARAARLIINADDFGIAPGVNRGIVEAHRAGVVTSTSLMATGAAFAGAVALARAEAPGLGVGVHLDLVHGRPLAPLDRVGTLVNAATGRFHSLGVLARRAVAGRIDPAEVAAECSAQIARVRDAGIVVTHVDSHRHAHLLPGLWSAVVAVATTVGVPVIRGPREVAGAPDGDVGATLKVVALRGALVLATCSAPAAVARPRSADILAGIALQGAGRHYVARLLATLDALRPGTTTELMVHPGRVDADLVRADAYTAPREVELAALCSPIVRARLRDPAISLVHFGALAVP